MTHIAMQEALDGSYVDLDGACDRRGIFGQGRLGVCSEPETGSLQEMNEGRMLRSDPIGSVGLQLRCAVQVPEQSAARQVPEPEVPEAAGADCALDAVGQRDVDVAGVGDAARRGDRDAVRSDLAVVDLDRDRRAAAAGRVRGRDLDIPVTVERRGGRTG